MKPQAASGQQGLTRRRLTAGVGSACLASSFGGKPAAASSIDGRGISNADVLAGFQTLRGAPMRFQDGRPFTIDAFHGRALLVNFWANWCVNCVAEFRSMTQLQQAAGGGNQFAMVLVSQPKDWAKDQAMARQLGMSFPLAVLSEPGTPAGVAATATVLMGNVVDQTARYGLPVCYMVGRSGQVVFAGSGGMNWVSDQAMAKAAQALRA